MVVFRSILVPLTATLGFVLSLLAAFGGITAIFQLGFLYTGLLSVVQQYAGEPVSVPKLEASR